VLNVLLPCDEDDATYQADDQGKAKIGNKGKRECHVFGDPVSCKNLDE
jgi:hypothetical protein